MENNLLFEDKDLVPKKIDKGIKDAVTATFKNMATVIAISASFVFIMSIWTDISLRSLLTWGFGLDAIFSALIYNLVRSMCKQNGISKGKIDPDYITTHQKYLVKRDAARQYDYITMSDFCSEYVAAELKSARYRILLSAGIKYALWEETYSELTAREVHKLKKVNHSKKLAIIRANKCKPIMLIPEMLLTDDADAGKRGGLSWSTSKYLSVQAKRGLVFTLMAVMFTTSIALNMSADASFATFVLCAIKILGLVWRASTGYSVGYLAYSDVGVRYNNSQISIINQFERWKENKKIILGV